MPETYTTPFVATTNAVIASSDHNASYGGNIRYFRQFLTNPDNANQWLQSTSADGADWVNRATAVLDALGFTPPNADTPIITTFAAALVANGSGFFEVSPAADGPTGSGAWYLLNLCEGNQPTTYAMQIACNINDQDALYHRLVVGGVAGTWRKVWHAGNDGSGSGLDADTLDGLSSAAFPTLASGGNFTTAPTISSATIWTSGNDGTGSGLDADNLDGFTWKQGKTGEFSGTQALTTSFADVSGASFTADRDGQWLVFARSENVMAIGDSHPSIQIVSGGVSQEEGVGNSASGTTMSAEATVFAFVTISGSTTVKAQVKKNANAATSNCLYAKIGGIWVAP